MLLGRQDLDVRVPQRLRLLYLRVGALHRLGVSAPYQGVPEAHSSRKPGERPSRNQTLRELATSNQSIPPNRSAEKK